MSDETKRRGKFPVVLAVIVLCVFGYFACYAQLGETHDDSPGTIREYKSTGIAKAFIPAAWMESFFMRHDVRLIVIRYDGGGPGYASKMTLEFAYDADAGW